MTFSKPYLSGDREYLEVYEKKTFEEGDPSGLTEYSEGQYPYSEKEDWPAWEWTWPEMPYPSPIDYVKPDPAEHPCSADDECNYAAIAGRDIIECPLSTNYIQAHVFVGCAVAPAWAAFGGWELDSPDDSITLTSSNPIMCVLDVPSDATNCTVILKYRGPLNCYAEKEIKIECQCCVNLEMTGNEFAWPEGTWTGTLTPACPNATAEVAIIQPICDPVPEWWSAPVVSEDGTQVTTTSVAATCGSMKITVTDGEGCEENIVSLVVKMTNTGQGGLWTHETDGNPNCGTGSCYPCQGNPDGRSAETDIVIVDEKKYGRGINECAAYGYERCYIGSDSDPSNYGCDAECSNPPPSPPVALARPPGTCATDPWDHTAGTPGECWPTAGANACIRDLHDWDLCLWTCACP